MRKLKRIQQNIGSILLFVSNYLKSLRQDAKDFMDEIEDASNETDYNKLLFISSNKEKFNFSIFSMPFNFFFIFNGKITFKKGEINQKDLSKN